MFHETEAYGITGVGQDRFDAADTIGETIDVRLDLDTDKREVKGRLS